MEVTDWDRSTRVLSGLHPPAYNPALYDQRYGKRWPDKKVQYEIKTIAVRLYNHQKMTPMFQTNVSNGNNNLAYMICASYEPSPPSTPEKNGRPKLKTSVPLPLGHWDRLYYSCIAEIRYMYSALQQQFGESFENGTTILHHAGVEGASGASRLPISAIGLAAVLEDMWDTINDVRLTSSLDLAVRVRHAQDQDSDSEDDRGDQKEAEAGEESEVWWETKKTTYKHTHDENCHCVAVAEGLADVHSMTPEAVREMVWTREAAEARRKSGRRSEEQTLLARCRAELRELSPHKRSTAISSSSHVSSAPCKCMIDCRCREVCDLQANECACTLMRSQVSDMIYKQEESHGAAHDAFDNTAEQLPNNVLGAATNDLAQMQVAALAEPDPFKMSTLRTASEASEHYSREVLSRHRNRANTNDSELVYVPGPRTPSRGQKDMYPLGFYGDSGQRYPPFRSNSKSSSAPPPVYGASFYSNQVPTRKPVPGPFTSSPDQWSSSGVTYPAIPPSESAGMFTQSFPVAAKGNARNIQDSGNDYTNLVNDTHDTMRPFSDDPTFYAPSQAYPDSPTLQAAQPDSPTIRPNLHMAHTSPAEMIVLPKRTTVDTVSSNINTKTSSSSTYHSAKSSTSSAGKLSIDLTTKPMPPIPEPDFIAPRQAQKQRWVPAGGNAKLSERQEIEGPAFKPVSCESSGAAIPKDELYARLNDPEFVRANFGEEAVVKMRNPSARPSEDNSPNSKRSSDGKKVRSQRDSQELLVSKRDRQDSNGGARFEKLRRVFSRKNSQCE